MPRPTGVFDDSPIRIVGYPSEIAEQIRYDEAVADLAGHNLRSTIVDLAEFKAGVADVKVTYKERQFTAGYRPESVTEDDLALLEAFSDKAGVELLRATVGPLTRLLVRWSLTMGDQVLPVSEESVTFLPPRMRVAILEAIMADFFNSGNATPSDDGSPAKGASEGTVQPLPVSSGTPNGLASRPGISPGALTVAAP